MFVALSKFVVANEMEDAVCDAFVNRPHLVESAPGFVRLDVIRPVEDPREFWLVTYWQNRESYASWHKGHSYKESHDGIPKGLKLVQHGQSVRFFEHIAS